MTSVDLLQPRFQTRFFSYIFLSLEKQTGNSKYIVLFPIFYNVFKRLLLQNLCPINYIENKTRVIRIRTSNGLEEPLTAMLIRFQNF